MLDDGTAGAAAVRRRGGVIVVHDPADVLFSDIPRSIIDHVGADHVLPSAEIGDLINRLTAEEVPDHMPDEREDPVLASQHRLLRQAQQGEITSSPVPECSGTLWEVDQDGSLQYRCRVGHVYSQETLRAAQGDAVETALWITIRALEEQADIVRRTAARSRRLNTPRVAARHDQPAEEIMQQAEVIRDLLDGLASVRQEAESAGE